MSDDAVDTRRRRFLTGTTAVIGGIGAAFTAVPFLSSFQPSARAKAIGAPVEVDISKLEPGQRLIQKWRGKPVFIRHRTPDEIKAEEGVELSSLPDPQPDNARVKKPEWLVVVGVCTHLGCIPMAHEGKYDGFFCPCHGSQYNRVGEKKGGPAPRGMDHFAVTVSPSGDVVVDTSIVVQGVPIGTNTTGQEAEGPHCITGGGGHG